MSLLDKVIDRAKQQSRTRSEAYTPPPASGANGGSAYSGAGEPSPADAAQLSDLNLPGSGLDAGATAPWQATSRGLGRWLADVLSGRQSPGVTGAVSPNLDKFGNRPAAATPTAAPTTVPMPGAPSVSQPPSVPGRPMPLTAAPPPVESSPVVDGLPGFSAPISNANGGGFADVSGWLTGIKPTDKNEWNW